MYRWPVHPKFLLWDTEPRLYLGSSSRLILVYQQHHFWSLLSASLTLNPSQVWKYCNHTLARGTDPHFMGPKTYMTLEILAKKNNTTEYLLIIIYNETIYHNSKCLKLLNTQRLKIQRSDVTFINYLPDTPLK